LALELDNGLDLIRFRWLEGQVHAALGRRKEAIPGKPIWEAPHGRTTAGSSHTGS